MLFLRISVIFSKDRAWQLERVRGEWMEETQLLTVQDVVIYCVKPGSRHLLLSDPKHANPVLVIVITCSAAVRVALNSYNKANF